MKINLIIIILQRMMLVGFLERKVKFRASEIVAYLEEKILHNEETEEEMRWYEDYKIGVVRKDKVLRSLLDEMSELWSEDIWRF